MSIELTPIGTIHSPHTRKEGMPIQPSGAEGIKGTVEVFEKFRPGLEDLEGFSHIILLYQFHLARGFKLQVTPFLDARPHGVFATRAPLRPNPIGLSIVKLDHITDGILHIENVDILDGTPVLDIKPYVPQFDQPAEVRTGWLDRDGKNAVWKKSDDRFTEP